MIASINQRWELIRTINQICFSILIVWLKNCSKTCNKEENILGISVIHFYLLGLIIPVILKLIIISKKLCVIKELWVNKSNWDGITDSEFYLQIYNLFSFLKLLSSIDIFCVMFKAMSICKGWVMYQEKCAGWWFIMTRRWDSW